MKSEPLGWRPGLDGLRGVAVLAVMLYHFHATRQTFQGGSLGVDLFFVLSGFLITTLLLEERWRTSAVSLAGFYQRRARRLLPALTLFLAAFVVITFVARQPGVEQLPLTVITSQFYVFNLVDDFGGTTAPGMGHLWSLSVEEQFYLVWPLVFIVALRRGPRTLFAASLLIFAVSASLPAWSGRGYGALYSGTDFRAQELMAGALLAQLRFSGLVTPALPGRAYFRAAVLLAVAFFVVYLFALQDRSVFLYSGLYTVTAVCGAVLVCMSLYAPPRILANPVMRYVGTRSYALYLWHHIINFWLRDMADVPALFLAVALSFAAAELSWRLVEGRNGLLFKIPRLIRRRAVARTPEPSVLAPVAQPSE